MANLHDCISSSDVRLFEGLTLQEVTVLTSLSNFVHHGMVFIPPVSLTDQAFCRRQLQALQRFL